MLAKKLLGSRQGATAAYSGTIVVAHDIAPYASAYPWSAGFGTKYADPGAQFIARPSSDITTTNWTRSSGTDAYYTYVDEVTADDNDYLETTVTNAGLEVKLSAVTDPQSSSGHVVRVRTWSVGSGQGEARTILLLQGSTTIATVATGNPSRTVGSQVDYTLTAAQADSITDYSDLRIRVTANTLGSGESIRFGWAELDVNQGQVPGAGRGVAFSPDGATIAVAHATPPFISVYPWSAGFGTKYADPASFELPTGTGWGVAFSPDGATIAVAHTTSPYITVYPWSAGFGTKYANPATLPTGEGRAVAFSPDGATIAVAHVSPPNISVYPWSAGFGTKYANPATLPTGAGLGVTFSPDGATIAVAHVNSPYISAYPWSAGFGTKYADPATLPPVQGNGVAFSPDGATIAVAHVSSPFISVYPWSAGFGTKYANPATLPTGNGFGVAFSPDGATIAVAHTNSPCISVYPWSAGFGTKYANPATLPVGNGLGVAFSP